MNKSHLTFIFIFLAYTAQATVFTNIRSGNWYDPTLWDKGTLPTGIDSVTVAQGTTVTVYGDPFQIDALLINGFLDVGSTNVTIGGRERLLNPVVRNTFCIINGGLRVAGTESTQFKVYGYVKFNTGSTFAMNSGVFTIDGCAFTPDLSVPADIPLLDVSGASSFQATGGMFVIFNAHYHPTGLAIKGAKYFNSVSFGEQLSLPIFAMRHTSDFLISETEKPTFGYVQVQYLPNPNRQNLVILNGADIAKNLELRNGVVTGTGRLKVGGNLIIAPNGILEADVEFNGNSQQNISPYSGIYSTSATIKGNLTINNGDRVLANLNLDVQNGTINMVKGKFDLADKTVSVSYPPTTVSPSSYFLTRNYYQQTGTLVVKNLTGSTLFPVGTENSYLPVTITAPSGDFSVSARPLSMGVSDGRFYINNQWDINRISGNSPADIEVQWNTTDENGPFSTYRSNAKLNFFDGSTWQPLSTGNIFFSNSVAKGLTQNVQNFSTFTMLTQVFIPITLKNFIGKAINQNVYLTWETSTEFNNKGFDIEKSTNGRDFTPIGFVKGAGNAFQPNTYYFVDTHFTQTAYYRLKQVDFDGKFTYSPTVTLQKTSEKEGIKIYPNPISHDQPLLTIDLSENNQKQANIAIFYANGRLIYQNTEGGDIVNVPTEDWSNGLYLIRLTTKNGWSTVYKFVKN